MHTPVNANPDKRLLIFEVVSGGTKEHHPPGGEDWSVIVAAHTPEQARDIACGETNIGRPWVIYEWGVDARKGAEPGILRGPFECCPAVSRQWKKYQEDRESGATPPPIVEWKTDYVLDGNKFANLAEAADHFTRALGFELPWNGNLDALNDLLHELGTPNQDSVLFWRHSEVSRERLGYEETIRWLEDRIRNCHPSNVAEFQLRLSEAKARKGATLFDTLLEIIGDHKDIELRLE